MRPFQPASLLVLLASVLPAPFAHAIPPAQTPTMFFEQNSYAVTDSVRQAVREALDGWVGRDVQAGFPVCIWGHAARSEADGDWLSLQRAKVVEQELIAAGFPAASIFTSSFAAGRVLHRVEPNDPIEKFNRYVIITNCRANWR